MYPKVVYTDASESAVHYLNLSPGETLRLSAQFVLYPGKPQDDDDYVRRMDGASGMMLGWGLPDSVLARLLDLKVISFTGIGVGNFVNLEQAAAQGVTVCNCPGYADDTVAEHTLALMLATARHVVRLDKDIRAGRWNQALEGVSLRGKRLGIIGLGGSGVRVAALAQALGMEVVAWTRNPSVQRAAETGVEFIALERLVSECDVVSLHLAHTPETEGLLDEGLISRMKPGAMVINTARGEIVDEAALMKALEENRIRAAGLDVYQDEPLTADHPWTHLDNVVLSPHVGFNTPEAEAEICRIAADNLVAYFAGSPQNVVAGPGE